MSTLKKSLGTSFASFAFGAVVCWFVFGMIVSPVSFVPAARDLSSASALDAAALVFRYSRAAIAESLLIFIAGFSVFPYAGAVPVMAVRGACLGATIRAITAGDVVFQNATSYFGVPTGVIVPLIHCLSSVCLFALAAAASLYSERFTKNESGRVRTAAAFTAVFAVFCGLLILLEFFRFTAVWE